MKDTVAVNHNPSLIIVRHQIDLDVTQPSRPNNVKGGTHGERDHSTSSVSRFWKLLPPAAVGPSGTGTGEGEGEGEERVR